MRLPARRSLRASILGLVLLTTGMSLLIAIFAIVTHDLQRYRRSASQDLSTQASILALSSASALIFDDQTVAKRNLEALRARPDLLNAALYRADGALFAQFVRPGAVLPAKQLEPSAAELLQIKGNRIKIMRPVLQNGERVGTVCLLGSYDVWGQIVTYAGISGLVLLGGLGAALALSQALQCTVTVPLEDLARITEHIKRERDYSQRARGGGPEEIELVVSGFNGMLDELEVRAQALDESMEALRESDRRKDEFLATLAHELRNPLAPIRHAVKLLSLPSIAEKQRVWGREVIGRQTERMALLLDDLLDISRITRGRLELKIAPVQLSAVLGSAVEAARPLIESKHQQLEVELPETSLELQADALRLSQAVSNLLINAAKYTDELGHIRLRAALSAGRLDIVVSDDGIGLSADVLPSLFEMFSQVDTALDRAQGGLGIGLALVKGLIGLHGGRVEAYSAGLGCGSTFTIHLPQEMLRAAPGSQPVPLSVLTTKGTGCRVLIADDNRDAADSLAMLLSAAGEQVATAYTGSEAWALATQWQPQVLVLDIGMPGLNGYELASRVRRQSWGSHSLLLAASGWGQQEDKDRALAAGFDRHLTKPFSPDELLGLIATFALGKRHEGLNTPSRSA